MIYRYYPDYRKRARNFVHRHRRIGGPLMFVVICVIVVSMTGCDEFWRIPK